MTRLYLVRHGETELNKKGCYYGWIDCGLSEHGLEQALLLRHALRRINLDAAITSDMKRAVDTAEILCEGRNIDLLKDERLRELNFGSWEGKHYTEVSEQHQENWHAWMTDWQNTAPAEGESFADMSIRVKACIDEIIQKYHDKDILLVAHQGVLRIITTYLLDIAAEKIWSFAFEQGSYSVLELQDDNCVVKAINKL